ncbi:MAG: lytic transglycosylase domain-containing protein [Deltaproteobacteria bacterium]|nr:lytic transglycosylase domain-containing protein [Deltaproteobacteria bacterium]
MFLLTITFFVAFCPSGLNRGDRKAPLAGIPGQVFKVSKPNLPPDRIPKRSSGREKEFQPIILEASIKYRVDPALVKAVIMAESNYNPVAVSKKGAVGLMQLMPSTAEALGVEELFDPSHNIHGGVKYLRQLLNHFEGDLQLAVAAYNAGISKVNRYQGIPPFKSTQYYVRRVFQYYQYYKEKTTRKGSTV